MVTYSLFLDDFADDDNDIVLNEHEDSIQPSESSFDATDADGDTVMQDVQENLKTPSISDVGNVLTMRPYSSIDFFMSPGSSVEDDESDADSTMSLCGLAFDDEDELDVDSLGMSSDGSSVGDKSDTDSATSLLGLEFLDEDELDEDSLFMSPVSFIDEELEVEELVTPSVLFLDRSGNVDEDNEREIESFADVGVDVFITETEDENRARWISLGCRTAHGLSLMFSLVFELISFRVFVFGCLFMWLSSMMMPGKVGRPIPDPVVYLSCPAVLPLRGVELATVEEDADGEVDDDEEDEREERRLRWSPLVPLRGVKLATIEEEGDGDVDEEEPDSLHCPPLVPLRALEEEVHDEQPQEQPEQEDNDDFGPTIVDGDEEDQFVEAVFTFTATSGRSEPTVPLVEIRRSSRIAAKAGKKLILPVGTEGSLFVNGKRRSARLSLF